MRWAQSSRQTESAPPESRTINGSPDRISPLARATSKARSCTPSVCRRDPTERPRLVESLQLHLADVVDAQVRRVANLVEHLARGEDLAAASPRDDARRKVDLAAEVVAVAIEH